LHKVLNPIPLPQFKHQNPRVPLPSCPPYLTPYLSGIRFSVVRFLVYECRHVVLVVLVVICCCVVLCCGTFHLERQDETVACIRHAYFVFLVQPFNIINLNMRARFMPTSLLLAPPKRRGEFGCGGQYWVRLKTKPMTGKWG